MTGNISGPLPERCRCSSSAAGALASTSADGIAARDHERRRQHGVHARARSGRAPRRSGRLVSQSRQARAWPIASALAERVSAVSPGVHPEIHRAAILRPPGSGGAPGSRDAAAPRPGCASRWPPRSARAGRAGGCAAGSHRRVLDQRVLEVLGPLLRPRPLEDDLGVSSVARPRITASRGCGQTAVIRSRLNSRPMVAPICASSFAAASRSSRAISESCSVAGIAIRVSGTASTSRPSSSRSWPRLEQRLGQLLDEERVAVRLPPISSTRPAGIGSPPVMRAHDGLDRPRRSPSMVTTRTRRSSASASRARPAGRWRAA